MHFLKWLIFFLFLSSGNSYALQIGDKAPDFDASTTLGDINFYKWSKNNWVILFSHPGDFTPVCTTELASAALLQSEFSKKNTKIIALSADSVEDHLEWIPDINRYKNILLKEKKLISPSKYKNENTDINYPIIADEQLHISYLYDMYHPNAMPNSNSLGSSLKETVRSVFIIDPLKKIQAILIYPKNIGRNFNEILRVLDALQISSKYNVSTPADWLLGDDVIIPNEVLIEDINDKYQTEEVNEFEDYLRFIKQPNFID